MASDVLDDGPGVCTMSIPADADPAVLHQPVGQAGLVGPIHPGVRTGSVLRMWGHGKCQDGMAKVDCLNGLSADKMREENIGSFGEVMRQDSEVLVWM